MGQATYAITLNLPFLGSSASASSESIAIPGIFILVSDNAGKTWSYDTSVANEIAGQLYQAIVGLVMSYFGESYYAALSTQAFAGMTGSPANLSCTSSSTCYIVTLPDPSTANLDLSASTVLATTDGGATFKVQSSIEEINVQEVFSSTTSTSIYENGAEVSSLPSFPSSSVSLACASSSTCIVGGTDSSSGSAYATETSGWTSPSLQQAFPPQASVNGGSMTGFTGDGLDAPGSAITIGNASANEVGCDGENICEVTAPASSSVGSVNASVTTNLGTYTLPSAIAYIEPPTVSSVAPASGPISGGTLLTITGANFQTVTGTVFSFGGIYASGFGLSCSSDTTCTLESPPSPIPHRLLRFAIPAQKRQIR
jgi:hypothetical protein